MKLLVLSYRRTALEAEPRQSRLPWRRGGDSNPRNPCRFTRFPSVRTRPLCDLSSWPYSTQKKRGRKLLPRIFRYIGYFFFWQPVQADEANFIQTAELIAKEIMDNEPVVDPKLAPPVPKCARYTAIIAAISANVRSRRTTLWTASQPLFEQQDIIEKGGNTHTV